MGRWRPVSCWCRCETALAASSTEPPPSATIAAAPPARAACSAARTAVSGTCGGKSVNSPALSWMCGASCAAYSGRSGSTVKVIGRASPYVGNAAAAADSTPWPQTTASCGRQLNFCMGQLRGASVRPMASLRGVKIVVASAPWAMPRADAASMGLDDGSGDLSRARAPSPWGSPPPGNRPARAPQAAARCGTGSARRSTPPTRSSRAGSAAACRP